jgi:hypothetical protein
MPTYNEEGTLYMQIEAHKRVCKYGRGSENMFTSRRIPIDENHFRIIYTCRCGNTVQFVMHGDDFNVVFD